MSNRPAEYRQMINEILDEDAALRARGIPGLEQEEWLQLRDLVRRVERKVAAQMPAKETVDAAPVDHR